MCQQISLILTPEEAEARHVLLIQAQEQINEFCALLFEDSQENPVLQGK